MSVSSVAVLAGGLATRLYPLTVSLPKSMVQTAGKPFIAHQLALASEKGIKKAVLCTGYLGEQISYFVKDGSEWGLEVSYSSDGDKLLGTGGALKKALPLLDDVFFVLYGDSYLDINWQEISRYFLAQNKLGLMTVLRNENQWDKSNVIYENGEIICYDKKNRTSQMKHIDYGLGILRKTAFEEFSRKDAFDMAELYQKLIAQKELLGFEVCQRFYEIGTLEAVAETEAYLLKRKGENNA